MKKCSLILICMLLAMSMLLGCSTQQKASSSDTATVGLSVGTAFEAQKLRLPFALKQDAPQTAVIEHVSTHFVNAHDAPAAITVASENASALAATYDAATDTLTLAGSRACDTTVSVTATVPLDDGTTESAVASIAVQVVNPLRTVLIAVVGVALIVLLIFLGKPKKKAPEATAEAQANEALKADEDSAFEGENATVVESSNEDGNV